MGGDDAVDSEPVVRATSHLKSATPSGHTFAHPHQAMPCPVGPLDASYSGSSPVVEDLQGDVAGVMADDDLGGGGRTAVLEDVGEGFLDDAVTGQLGALGEGFVAFRVALDPEVDGQRSLHLLDQTRNVTRLRMAAAPGMPTRSKIWTKGLAVPSILVHGTMASMTTRAPT